MVYPLDSKTGLGSAEVKIATNEIVSQFVRLISCDIFRCTYYLHTIRKIVEKIENR
jgi:hypothetical protein